jgi:hypothetical protein
MTRRLRPCSHIPGDRGDPARCPHLTADRTGLCDKHRAAMHAAIDARRPTASQRGYGASHQAARARDLKAGRTCAVDGCERSDKLNRDHADGNPRNNRPDNIQYLCPSHHSGKTLTRDVDRDEHGRILPKHRERRQPTRKLRSV